MFVLEMGIHLDFFPGWRNWSFREPVSSLYEEVVNGEDRECRHG